jgi:hypothetical protein
MCERVDRLGGTELTEPYWNDHSVSFYPIQGATRGLVFLDQFYLHLWKDWAFLKEKVG